MRQNCSNMASTSYKIQEKYKHVLDILISWEIFAGGINILNVKKIKMF